MKYRGQVQETNTYWLTYEVEAARKRIREDYEAGEAPLYREHVAGDNGDIVSVALIETTKG